MPTTTTTTTTTSPMICTFNIEKFTRQSVLPSDGTCDMIFLDSLYRKSRYQFDEFPSGAVEDFLIVANESRYKKLKTKMGLAFNSHSPGYQSIVLHRELVHLLNVTWEKYGISYYGCLDGNIRAFSTPETATALWLSLAYVRSALVNIAGAKDDYAVVLGVTSTDILQFRAQVAADTTGILGLTHLVIISHTSSANYAVPPYENTARFDKSNCFIVPPSLYEYKDGYNVTYYSTMRDSSEFLQYLQSPHVGVPIPISISVTLKGRWFTAAAPAALNLDLLKKCDDFTNVHDAPPSSVCPGQYPGLTYQNSPTYKSVIWTNATGVFTFEVERTLKEKICDMKNLLKTTKYGLAVYDIDADTEAKPCPQVLYTGQYKRLKMLRKLNDFMAAFTTIADCQLVT